ncbi:MAG: asparagine synthase [Planctomycetota bacterium]|jgi:asparagine synthase (glutamine-hydrolysing)
MCGIIGFYGQFAKEQLISGLAAIRHRGPDDDGIWVDAAASVGLGHARLSIIDLSPLGHQPMSDQFIGVELVFNGEIYNYRELRAQLEARGHTFRGHSDTEVLLHMYLEHGTDMFSQLNGIFTLAIWDPRTRELTIARDALGVKPLYFAEAPRGIGFCSEIKGLLHLVPEVRELDAASLHRYLTFLWCPGEGTPLKAVRKVLPGEALTISDGRIKRRWAWYQLPVFRAVAQDIDEHEAISGTAQSVRAAVHRQMVADVPVGAFLSGGLDSSAVVTFAREVDPNLRCFTIETTGGQERGETDDLPYARRVAKHLGVPLECVRIDASRMASDLESMVVQLDEPLADPAPLNVLYICQLARQHGMKVLLSGAGGDDLFTGYRRHRAIRAERLWGWLPSPARSAVERVTASLDQRRPSSRRLAKLFRGASLTGDPRIANYFAWARNNDLLALYSPEMLEAVGGVDALAPMTEFIAPLPRSVVPIDRMLALDQRFFLADHNLTYTDKMSMAVGVEVRVPFLDLELVDFAARIPARFKQRGAVGKWAFKRSMEPYLPKDVIYRPKSGFTAPLRRWMHAEFRPMIGDLLSAESLRRRGIFDPSAVLALVEANLAGRIDANHTILSLLCIEIWCRHFVDRTSDVSPANYP